MVLGKTKEERIESVYDAFGRFEAQKLDGRFEDDAETWKSSSSTLTG